MSYTDFSNIYEQPAVISPSFQEGVDMFNLFGDDYNIPSLEEFATFNQQPEQAGVLDPRAVMQPMTVPLPGYVTRFPNCANNNDNGGYDENRAFLSALDPQLLEWQNDPTVGNMALQNADTSGLDAPTGYTPATSSLPSSVSPPRPAPRQRSRPTGTGTGKPGRPAGVRDAQPRKKRGEKKAEEEQKKLAGLNRGRGRPRKPDHQLKEPRRVRKPKTQAQGQTTSTISDADLAAALAASPAADFDLASASTSPATSIDGDETVWNDMVTIYDANPGYYRAWS
ncbi:MAG: hypothetical protein Q9160_004922 [Pyrenula sp. 1 TL-2023]